MISIYTKIDYEQQRELIKTMIDKLFINDDDPIADTSELMNHLDFIFSLKDHESFLLLNIVNNQIYCMANFLEYTNISKDWCVFSVFTKKEQRGNGFAKDILNKGIEIIKTKYCNNLIAGITPKNIASQKLHQSIGFVDSGLSWDQVANGFPENHKCYIYKINNIKVI